MRKTIVRIVSVVSLTVLLFALPIHTERVFAESVDELRNELAQLQQEAKEIQSQLDSLGDSIEDQQVEVNQLYKKVSNLEKQIDAYKSQIAAIDTQIAEQTERIETLNTEIAAKEVRMEEIMTKLKKRVKAITQTNQYSSFQLLMSTEDYADYLLKAEILNSVSEHDKALRDEAEAEKQQIQIKKDAVEQERAESEAAKAELETLKGDLDKQFNTLDKLYVTAKNKEDKLLKQQNSYEKKLQQIQASEDELDREIAALLNGTPPASTYGGKMYWPAPTVKRISSGYGNRSSGYHRAIDIANGRALGEPIVAAASGTVIKVQSMHYSYGNFCMIDHGLDAKGVRIVTLYAHMRYTPSVKVGQHVTGGVTQIGVIGNTGQSYGAHLHFEVREDNVRVDPIGKGYVVVPK